MECTLKVRETAQTERPNRCDDFSKRNKKFLLSLFFEQLGRASGMLLQREVGKSSVTVSH